MNILTPAQSYLLFSTTKVNIFTGKSMIRTNLIGISLNALIVSYRSGTVLLFTTCAVSAIYSRGGTINTHSNSCS